MLTQVRQVIVEEKAVEEPQKQRVWDTKGQRERYQHETARRRKGDLGDCSF